MMQRYSSSHGNMMGACCCGMYHSQSNSFCGKYRAFDEEEIMYSSHSPTTVDCTLSLATPSTRRLTNDEKKRSSFGWNVILPSKHTSSTTTSAANNHRAGNGADPLLARRCANCDTTSTPLWRNGPRGPKSLCNACGIRFKKEERRAMAVSATTNEHATNNSWAVQPQKMGCHGNELRFIEEEQYYHREEYSASGIPFLSWRLNVTDMSHRHVSHRPSLVHDFTR